MNAGQLDQHLEALQDAGIKDLVRLGSRSQSFKLKSKNLKILVSIWYCTYTHTCMHAYTHTTGPKP